jgi:hypothetical protein
MLSKVLAACALFGIGYSVEIESSEAPNECPMAGMAPFRNSDEDVSFVQAFFGDADPLNPSGVNSQGEPRAVLLVPYATGKCTAMAPVSAPNGMFVCDADNNGFTYKTYKASDTSCSGEMQTMMHYNTSTLQPAALFGFNCGASNSHVEIILSAADPNCNNQAHVYLAINECTPSRLPPALTTPAMAQWSCHKDANDDLKFTTTFFAVSDGGLCTDPAMCLAATFPHDDCSAFLTSSSGTIIYIQTKNCVSADVDMDGDEDGDDSSAMASFSFAAVLLSALLAVVNA